MKRLLTLLIFAISLQTYAQLPDAFNYQATIRAESGDLLVNTNVNFKVTIFEGQGVGDSYVESHFVPTDDLGHVNFVVGYGQPLEGSMSEIDWSMGNYFMKVELDTGQGFVDMGDTQLLSVPYALYAMDSGGEAGDLQSVLDAGSEAEILLSDDNLEGVLINSSGGNNAQGYYSGIQSVINGTDGRNTALRGISSGENVFRNYGVWGIGTNSSGINSGVVGAGDSEVGSNRGVWGVGRNSSISNQGIYGFAGVDSPNDADNRGVFGVSTSTTNGYNYGVSGVASGSETSNIAGGFYAEGGTTQIGENYGVVARATSNVGTGTNFGVRAEASGASLNYGILSIAVPENENTTSYAGYFVGDVYVDQSGYLKAENQPVADNDVVNKAYLESVLQSYDDRIAVLEEVVESLQEAGSLLVDQDGNILLTEDYGEDTWTTDNAKVVTYRDGTPIPYVADLNDQFATSVGHWTYANGDPSTGEILYNRQAIMGIWDADSAGDPSQRKELAPEGWHVASNEDWNSLIEYMTNTYGGNFAKEMASTEGWVDLNIDDTPGTVPEENNASGFNLKPSGYGLAPGGTYNFGEFSVVWGEYDESNFLGKYFFMSNNQNYTGFFDIDSQDFFFSVRFVQGEAEDNNVDGYCGNGIIEQSLGEQCDDGNDDPNDGCDGCMIVGVDLDGDGYSVAQGDCDDNNIYVYPGAVEVCDQVDNNCNGTVDELDENTFIGTYNLTTISPGIFGSTVFDNGLITITQGESLNSRQFDTYIYSDLLGGSVQNFTLNFSLVCGNVIVDGQQNTGVSCGTGVFIGPSTETGTYNELDDSYFTLIINDDETGDCGESVAAQFLLEKVN